MILTIFAIIVLLFSIVIHEVAHGSVAYYLGDPTAKYSGRLTLNPIKHLDPFGSVILPLILSLLRMPVFGWAKPVPINPYNFRDQKWGELKVAVAGPASNLVVALFFGLLIRFLNLPYSLLALFSFIVVINLILAIFNLIPIPPLDGHWILFSFLPEEWNNIKMFLKQYGFFILIFLIFFGLEFVFVAVSVLFFFITGQPLVI